MRTSIYTLVFCICTCNLKIYAQSNVAINNTGLPPHPTAMLDVSSFDQGILIPRMESWVKYTILNPAEGLIVCDTTLNSLWMYIKGNWEELAMKYNTPFTNDFGIIHNTGNISGDDFVFGSTDLNENGNSAHRKRFYFDKSKSAFRAGELFDAGSTALEDESKRWDADSVGIGSIALGTNTMAKNYYSVAIGGNAVAKGYGSVAIGNTVFAEGTASVALGITDAYGDRSFAVGSTNDAIGYASTAMGELTIAYGKCSSSLGNFTRSDAFASVAIGRFNVGGGDSSNWVFTDPIFEIGNGSNFSNRQNAFTILKDGRTGIRTSSPQSMLQIEQPNSGPGNGILLHLSGHGNWETLVTSNSDYNFYFNNNLRAHLTEQGTFHLPENLSAGLSGDGNIVIGQTTGKNVTIDNNEIMARNASGPDELLLQKDGGWVGIGTSPMSTLDVDGNFVVGTNYAGSLTAPPNGAIIEGYVGIGTHYPYNRMDVSGNLAVGSAYSGSATFAPTDGAIIEGSVGIGTSVVQNKLDVEGGVAIGSAFAGTAPGPVNGLAIEGDVGIGTLVPANKLDVSGKITLSQSIGNEMVIINGNVYEHIEGSQDFGLGGVYFMLSSKELTSENSGVYGDGNYVTIWSPGDDDRLVRFLDEDFFDGTDANPYNNTAEKAYIDGDGDYFKASDANMKRDIKKIDNALDKIKKMNGYTYRFNLNSAELAKGQKNKTKNGVIAQEVEKIIPEAVSKNESGQYFVNYDALIPVLIEGLKEQQKTIEELQKKIENLEKK